MPHFSARLRARQLATRSLLCVGLDPDLDRLPTHLLAHRRPVDAVIAFNHGIIEATADLACAFKVNFAFFEALGRDGWAALEATIDALPEGVLSIADAKRGDIGNSARFYAASVFEHLGFDACTVSPYMGADSVRPFLEYADTATFVLGRTSNPGAADFQRLRVDGRSLYQVVGEKVAAWSAEAPGEAGLVVGATDVEALSTLRAACPTTPFLVPGVGAQGGDAKAVVEAAATPEGLVLVNSSRSILYASGGEDFADAARRAAETLAETLAVPD